MKIDQIIKKAKMYDNEDLHFELKRIEKYINSKTQCFDDAELLKLIVGFANREGGQIVIGINDDGTPEGIGIFDRFSYGNKSGIDKFKEFVVNSCLEKISPAVNIEVNYYVNEEYEFAEIYVPRKTSIPHAVVKMSNGKIDSRKYFIKTSHSVLSVSDTQLAWLFSNNNHEVEENWYEINVTTYKELGGIPSSMGKIGDTFVMQPYSTDFLVDFLHYISEEAYEKCKSDLDYRTEILTESLIYAIVQSIEGRSRVVGNDAIELPNPPSDFKLHDAITGNEDKLFLSFHKKISFPAGVELSVEKRDREVSFTMKNEYFSMSLNLIYQSWYVGFSGMNPYRNILVENHGYEGQEYLTDRYETYGYILNTKISRFFPEIISKNYYISNEFADNFNLKLKQLWDINYFMKEYPHYKSLYSIEYKIDRMMNIISKNNTDKE